MKVLMTGAGGMLAEDLAPCLLQRGYEVYPLAESEMDICDLQRVRSAVSMIKPQLLINCAAYTDVDGAESNRDLALRVNGLGVKNLALVCAEAGCHIVHFSTDYIFDGKKRGPYGIHDEPHPLNAYGKSKLEGERYLQQLAARYYLIRTSWLFGLHGKNFVETMLDLAKSKKSIKVVNEQRGCPTWTIHLSEAVADLIATERYGIYHITNSGSVTWCDYAREIFRLSGANIDVIPVKSEELPRLAKRPHNSILDAYPLPEVLKRNMPLWQEALTEYLELRNL